MAFNISNANMLNSASEEEKLKNQTETIKKFFNNKISVIFQNSDETDNGISTLNQIPVKHKQLGDIYITEQNSYENPNPKNDDDTVKVGILVPTLKDDNQRLEKNECSECDFVAKTKKSIHNHIKIEHKGLTFKCKECEFQTQFKINLSRHKNIHEGTVHTCNQCKSIFR